MLEAGKKADAAASPAPTCLLSEFAAATELDGERMAELYRAGYVMLAANYVHCNKINVRAPVWRACAPALRRYPHACTTAPRHAQRTTAGVPHPRRRHGQQQ